MRTDKRLDRFFRTNPNFVHIIDAIKNLEDINTYYLKDTDIPINELIDSIINSLYVALYLMEEKINRELSKKGEWMKNERKFRYENR